MAADLHLGAVYFEDATGDDAQGDLIEITFRGGAPGTQLTRIVIDGDKEGNGRSTGDVFFDTASGDLGAFGHFPLTVVAHNGFQVLSAQVVDGGSKITIDVLGFDPGEKLVISVDADEIQFIDSTTGEIDVNALVEGGEFQRSKLTGSFTAPHFFDVSGSALFFDAYDVKFDQLTQASGLKLDLPPDVYVVGDDFSDRTAGAATLLEQPPLPITIAGTVFEDFNLNIQQELGDPGIGGVQLSLWKFNGSQYVATGLTTSTDSAGHYKFEGVLPGRYCIRETQPAGYFSVGAHPGDVAGSTRGIVVSPDEICEIDLLGGEDSIHNDFAEARPASIAGKVHADLDGDCEYDPGEPNLAGVTIELLNAQGQVIRTTLTDENGNYKFDNLLPGTYGVHEIQPVGYYDSEEHAGSAGGVVSANDLITGAFLGSGVDAIEYDFCELLPASISGKVHADLDGDCEYDPGEPNLAGVTLELLDAQGNVVRTTLTDEEGNYKFDNLAPGTYGVHEIQPVGYYDSEEHAGSAGGVVSANDTITGAVLGSGVNAIEYDFCELLPASISGKVHVDLDGDCEYDPGEPNLAGVTIELLDAQGQVIRTTLTDSNGNYKFDNLVPGTYGVHEIQPVGYYDSEEHAGSAGGVVSANDTITGAVLGSGVDAIEYDFCELLPASISGKVHADLDGDCEYDPGEPNLAGVTIELLDAQGNVIRTTLTDSDGNYKFDNLVPGTYGVHEIQPVGYYDSEEHAGSAGGLVSANDTITGAVLGSGVNAVEYDFCELLPASISGKVHVDLDGDCEYDPGEPNLAGVTIELLDAQGNVVRTTLTDADGNYKFDNLVPGTYGVHEIQPAGYYDSEEHAGSAGGVVSANDTITGAVLGSGVNAIEYDFCELLPASIRGRVHVDVDGDCELDPDEVTLAGVLIHLLDQNGNIIGTTTTDVHGEYAFTDLSPGSYGVREVQPIGYFDSGDTAGSAGGTVIANDLIVDINLAGGVNAVDYNFCEEPGGSISGYVFVDGAPIETNDGQLPAISSIRDGKLTSDDRRLAGVTLELRDGVTGAPVLSSRALPGTYPADQPIRVVTDANGHYEFRGLPSGVYGVYEVQPEGVIDSLDTPGSLGGLAFNENQSIDPLILDQLEFNPNNDAIIRIALFSGQNSVENNFSEVTTVTPFFFTIEPPPPQPIIHTAVVAPPVPFNPLMPDDLLALAPRPYYSGSSPVRNYTWHLSVIDGGRPRGQGYADATVKLTKIHTDPSAWKKLNLREASWTLAEQNKLRAGARRVFGMRDAIPVTGDFNGDGITDIGVFYKGDWYIDLNGNGVWDEGDLWAKLGHDGDLPVTGDWDGDGKTDIGIYGPAWSGDPRAVAAEPGLPDPDNLREGKLKNVPPVLQEAAHGYRSLKLTSQGSIRADIIDHVFYYGTPKDFPVVGDWNGDGIDTIGVFHDGSWYRDTDGDGKWSDKDHAVQFGQAGDKPVVGDWNGDGVNEVGVYRNGTWILDSNGNGAIDAEDRVVQLGSAGDTPVVGDWNGDGRDEPGLYERGAGVTQK